ncbi:MAG: stage III sporulation protein AB, partial [Clostridia bacterium]|nr:stage III sporulation protein AB [Clostridia bacterium]
MLILCACTAIGFSAAAMYRLRVEQLEGFRSLVGYIGAQIGVFLTPLERIYADFKNTRLEACGFLELLRNGDGEAAVYGCRTKLFLNDTEINEVIKFFRGLGLHDAKEEERHCAYYEKRFVELCTSAKAEAVSKVRLCRTFGFLGGLMLEVILI